MRINGWCWYKARYIYSCSKLKDLQKSVICISAKLIYLKIIQSYSCKIVKIVKISYNRIKNTCLISKV